MSDIKARLLEVAEDSVRRTGLKALSFRTLASEVGIKSSSVHYHFPEKSDLARELIERYRDRLFANLDTLARSNMSLREQLVQFANLLGPTADQNRVCLLAMLCAEFPALKPDNQRLLANVFSNLEIWLTNLIDSRREELSTPCSANQLAKTLLSGLEGAMMVDRVMQSTERFEQQKMAVLDHLHPMQRPLEVSTA